MGGKTEEASTVFDDWSLYDKIIRCNYMRHHEIADVIQSFAGSVREPLHVLDLGCGDGWMANASLCDSDVATYVGIDLSAEALQAARKRLSEPSRSVVIRQANLESALAQNFDRRPNLVLASYSLHHLLPDKQSRLIKGIAGLMAVGWLIWIDLQRRQQESREAYLQRFFRGRTGAMESTQRRGT